MSDELTVSGDVLRQHSARVDQVAGEVATAQAAADTTELGNGAFGLLCSFLPLFIAQTDSAAREAIASVHDALDAVVSELGSMATSFEATDQDVEATMMTVTQGLGR